MQKNFEKNIFSPSTSRSKFLKKSLSKMTIFSSKMKWHFLIVFFSTFLISKRYSWLKFQFYKEKVIFWSASCWCSSKTLKNGGAWKAVNVAFEPPSYSVIFWGTSTWFPSKGHIFHLKLIFQEKKNFWNWKNWTTLDQKVPLHPAAKNGHFTKGFSQNL